MENIYSLLIGHIQKVISWILNIPKCLINISVHIFWLLITVIMQLNLIIVFCGTLVVLLLLHIGQIIRLQLRPTLTPAAHLERVAEAVPARVRRGREAVLDLQGGAAAVDTH